MRKKIKKFISENFNIILVSTLFFLALLLLNTYTIYTSDDISYLYVYQSHMPTENTRRVEDLADVIESISNHYQLVNGRSLPHFILQSLGILGKSFFNIANSLVFLLVGELIIRNIIRKEKNRTWDKYFIVFGAMFLLIPQFGQSVLWISGSVNYLWMLVFILLASLAFIKWDKNEKVNPILAILTNLLAGMASENGSGMVILLGGLFIIKWFIEKRKIPKASFLAVLAASLGLSYQLASPGNFTRLDDSAGIYLAKTFPVMAQRTLETCGPLLLILLILLILTLVNKGKISRIMPIYVISALAGALVMVFTPNLAPRSWLWSVAFIMIAIGVQLNEMSFLKKKNKTTLSLITMTLLLIILVPTYISAFTSIFTSFNQHLTSLDQLAYQKINGEKNVVVEKFDLPENRYNPLSETYHLREDPHYWFNQWFAFHYGVEAITISNPEEAR